MSDYEYEIRRIFTDCSRCFVGGIEMMEVCCPHCEQWEENHE